MSRTELPRKPRRGAAAAAVLALCASAALLSACNTLAGAGQDVSASGHVVTTGAEKVKSGL
jgi:predicted small secreted protein